MLKRLTEAPVIRRLLLPFAVVLVLLGGPSPSAQNSSAPSSRELVGTWTLDRLEEGGAPGQSVRATNSRGLLIVDSAGHVFEFVTRPSQTAGSAGQPQLTDAQNRFNASAGFWGGYRADMSQRRITFTPAGAVHPNLTRDFVRSFEVAGDKLTITSAPGEPHTRGVTRWTWEKVPAVENLSPGYSKVVGFWQHVVEKRVNLTLKTAPESRRAPSVIVYSPSGFVGVHFPPLNRQPFASDVPTDAEARAALQGYVGYFGALTVYRGQVFHNILAGISPAPGTILKRFFELNGEEVDVKFPVTVNQQGQETTTYVTLKRLSGVDQLRN
jgi:hypothetical protein